MKKYLNQSDIIYSLLYFYIKKEYRFNEIPKIGIYLNDDTLDKIDNIYNLITVKYYDVGYDKTLKETLELKSDYKLYINDFDLFIDLLGQIVNININNILYYKINSYLEISTQIIQTLFLRMGVNDFNDPISFLRKELAFLKDKTFSKFDRITPIGKYEDYDICVIHELASLWDEATNKLKFYLFKDGIVEYSLFDVLYGIDNDNCYIYAIQKNKDRIYDKKIRRSLYKINRNKEFDNIEPGKRIVLINFVELLEKYGIKRVSIPLIQVLSYDLHFNLSNQNRKELYALKEKLNNNSDNNMHDINRYQLLTSFVDKEDIISLNKTEKLFELMNSVCEDKENIELINDIDCSINELIYRLK